jgi:tetratricopeptide (TPR) repeat protein
VPIYATGSERGVHYYAMQFIEGRTLAALIGDLRRAAVVEDRGSGIEDRGSQEPSAYPTLDAGAAAQPTIPHGPRSSILDPRSSIFRTAAGLGIQAAEALEHAHQLGVIHRDVKPGNLLVDGGGRLWVTDFGLAHCQSQAGLTMTGDLVGTLRYMSPEQALGQRVVVDHRTDVYSLGVTLYELLTLQSAFPGGDRQELLRQIALEEPKPPRRLNPALPAELETIVLKAMAKEPADRYATAQELAEDLRRFLEDRPIRARRPTLLKRLRSWSRRHRPVVWSAGLSVLALMLIAFGVLAVSYGYVRAEKNEKERALDTAEKQRQLAEANLDLARRAVDEVYEEWASDLFLMPDTAPAHRKMLHKALEFYQEFAKQQGSDRRIRYGTGMAYLRIAAIQHDSGQNREAKEAIAQALRLLGELAAEEPAKLDYQVALAEAHYHQGQILNGAGQPSAAEPSFRRMAELWMNLSTAVPANPNYRAGLAQAHIALAMVTTRPGEAEAVGSAALSQAERLVAEFPDEPGYWYLLADILVRLGRRHQLAGRLPEAETAFRKILTLERTAGASPSHVGGMPSTSLFLAQVLQATGRTEEAASAYREAIARFERAVVAFRHNTSFWVEFYSAYGGLATVLETTGRADELTAVQHKALDVFADFAAEIPDDPLYHEALGRVARTMPGVVKDHGPVAGKEELYCRALEVTRQLAVRFPHQTVYAFRVAYWQSNLGDVLWEVGRTREAEEAFRKAAAGYRAFLDREPDHVMALNNLAWLLVTCPATSLQDGRQALELVRKAVALRPEEHYLSNTLGIAHYRMGDLQAAAKALEKSIALNARRPESARAESFDTFFLAMVHCKQGDQATARGDYDRAVRWMEQYRPNDLELRRFRAEAEAVLSK